MIRKGFVVDITKDKFGGNRPYSILIKPRNENGYSSILMSKEELEIVRDKITEFLEANPDS